MDDSIFLNAQMKLDKMAQKDAMDTVYHSPTFQFLLKQKAVNRQTLKKFHFGVKFEIIIMLLANRKFESLYWFGMLCRFVNERRRIRR